MDENEKTESVLSQDLWDAHLRRQFRWTSGLRRMIYDKINLKSRRKILDAGCGIGLISKEMGEISGGEVHGIDVSEEMIEASGKNFPEGRFLKASVEDMPYEDGVFDVVFSHFVLMWAKNPGKAIKEMKRVAKPGGLIVCAAEPDYGGKIVYPEEFNPYLSGTKPLILKGANPFFGRKLKATLSQNGLKPEAGVFAELWDDETLAGEFEYMWDLAEKTAENKESLMWLKAAKTKQKRALENGELITFLPIFWGIAENSPVS